VWPSVHHPQAGTWHRDDDVVSPYFYVEVLHPVAFDATLFHTIHPNARALWLAAFHARA